MLREETWLLYYDTPPTEHPRELQQFVRKRNMYCYYVKVYMRFGLCLADLLLLLLITCSQIVAVHVRPLSLNSSDHGLTESQTSGRTMISYCVD